MLKALILLVCVTQTLHAQGPRRIDLFNQETTTSTPKLVAGGLVGGVIGFFGGGYAGAVINDDPNNYDDLDALGGAIVGATVGESILLPIGVHLANHRKGKILPAILASTGIGAGGMALALALQENGAGFVLALTPIVQLFTTIKIEQSTSR